jgi:hypothetical protein
MGFRFFTWLYKKNRAASPQGELYLPFYPHAAVYPYYHPHLANIRKEA